MPDRRVVRTPTQDRGAGHEGVRLAASAGLTVFTPTKDDVRRFFRETWHKHCKGQLLSPLEALALDWIVEHPEYHADLEGETATQTEYRVEEGRTNPFLHLSMHLAISEQLSIDQPPGIRAAFERLLLRRGDRHAAAHEVMECLGEMVWNAQRAGSALPPDEMSARYLECLARRAGRD